jgi:hypothetical protein
VTKDLRKRRRHHHLAGQQRLDFQSIVFRKDQPLRLLRGLTRSLTSAAIYGFIIVAAESVDRVGACQAPNGDQSAP